MISASLVLRRHQSSLMARQHPPPSLSNASSVAVPPPQDDRARAALIWGFQCEGVVVKSPIVYNAGMFGGL
eukprot:12385-Eustigmatos_ZCMA.PRE.1